VIVPFTGGNKTKLALEVADSNRLYLSSLSTFSLKIESSLVGFKSIWLTSNLAA